MPISDILSEKRDRNIHMIAIVLEDEPRLRTTKRVEFCPSYRFGNPVVKQTDVLQALESLQDLHDLGTALILEDLKPRRTAVVITAVRAVVVVEVKIEVGYAQRF